MSTGSTNIELAAMTWQDARDRLLARPVGLLPIGAIEAHGPHLPLDTDVIIAEATARRSAERLGALGIPCIILPAIAYTVSFAGTSFEGTTPADSNGLEAYLTSVLINAARQGYRGLVCCNAHLEPAHVERVRRSAEQATAEVGIPVVFPDQRSERFTGMLSEEFQAGARHAGSYETSIVLYAAPEAVRTESLAGLPPVWIDLPARLREGAKTFVEAGSELGYFGDPARANASEGDRMLDALAEMIEIVLGEAGVIPVR